MSLPPEKNLAAEENIKEINTGRTGFKKKNLLIISVLVLTALLVFMIIKFNYNSFKVITPDQKVENESYHLGLILERRSPRTNILLVRDKKTLYWEVHVINFSDQPIKFYPINFRLEWTDGTVKPISTVPEITIFPNCEWHKIADGDIYNASIYRIMYYPSDNPKTGVTATVKQPN